MRTTLLLAEARKELRFFFENQIKEKEGSIGKEPLSPVRPLKRKEERGKGANHRLDGERLGSDMSSLTARHLWVAERVLFCFQQSSDESNEKEKIHFDESKVQSWLRKVSRMSADLSVVCVCYTHPSHRAVGKIAVCEKNPRRLTPPHITIHLPPSLSPPSSPRSWPNSTNYSRESVRRPCLFTTNPGT